MAPKQKFSDGEKVLCFHGPLLYEAKCMKSQAKEKHIKYYIHYSGWNKNWDEWVPETRVLKFNDANLQKQKVLQLAHGKIKKTKAIKTGTKRDRNAVDREKSALPTQERTPKQRATAPAATPAVETPADIQRKNWDKRVPETRVLKLNDANFQKQKDLDLAHGKIKKTKSVKTGTERSRDAVDQRAKQKAATHAVATPANARRRQRNQTEQIIVTDYVEWEIEVKIPDELKCWLVDDWDLIARQKKFPTLPAQVSMDQLIADFVKVKMAVEGMTPNKETVVTEVTNGIKHYFNVMLVAQLLYKPEKPRHAEVVAANPNLTMTQLYGAIHLLRFFTKLGAALSYTTFDKATVRNFSAVFQDFLKFLSKNATTYFSLSDYVPASAECSKLIHNKKGS